jgi:hypothetical protein
MLIIRELFGPSVNYTETENYACRTYVWSTCKESCAGWTGAGRRSTLGPNRPRPVAVLATSSTHDSTTPPLWRHDLLIRS